MMLQVIFVFTVPYILQIRCTDLLDVYHQVCPYNTLCTRDPLYHVSDENGTLPCCEQCSCDEKCWLRNDCCPDVPFDRPPEVDKLKCRPAAHFCADDNCDDHKANQLNVLFTHYLMIDACPVASDSELKQKCNGSLNAELEDFVVVSSKARPYEIFMNKHCARCHGVNDLIPWRLQAEKCVAKYLMRATETLDSMKKYLKERCILHSLPPDDLHLGRLPICRSGALSTCKHARSQLGNTDGLRERCASEGHLLAIEHYYTRSGSLEYQRYKNPFCLAACRVTPNVSDSVVTCRKEVFEYPRLRGFKDFTILLNTGSRPTISHEISRCNESFVYDEYRHICRKLHCPHVQHAFYGKCVSITKSVPDLSMAIHFVLIPDQSIIIKGDIEPLSKITAEEITGEVITGLKLEDCRFYSVLFRAFQYRDTLELLSVNMRILVHPSADGKCTRLTMAGNLSSNFGHFQKFKIPINGRIINMKGRFDVFKPPGYHLFHTPFLYFFTRLYQTGGTPFITDIPKLPCPFVILEKDEFCSFVGEFLGGECNRNVSLDMPENLFDDLFPLDENSVGICLKSYQQYTLSTASLQGASYNMTALVLLVVLSVIKFYTF